jgi:hypothetical protein
VPIVRSESDEFRAADAFEAFMLCLFCFPAEVISSFACLSLPCAGLGALVLERTIAIVQRNIYHFTSFKLVSGFRNEKEGRSNRNCGSSREERSRSRGRTGNSGR